MIAIVSRAPKGIPSPCEREAFAAAGDIYRLNRLEETGLFEAIAALRRMGVSAPVLEAPAMAGRLAAFDPDRTLARGAADRRLGYRRALGPSGAGGIDALLAALAGAPRHACADAAATLRERAAACRPMPGIRVLEALVTEAGAILDSPPVRAQFGTLTGWGVVSAIGPLPEGTVLSRVRSARAGRAVLRSLHLPLARLMPLLEDWMDAAVTPRSAAA